jgi:hypothetical protein
MRARYASVMLREVCRPERIASCSSAIGVSSNSNGFTGAAALSAVAARSAAFAEEKARAVPANPPRRNVLRFISNAFQCALPVRNLTNVHLRVVVLLFGFFLAVQPRFARGDVDFSHYDVPLYTQIVNRIKANIAPRLGTAPLTKERYFMIPFAYQDDGNHPEKSHSFISVIRVFADDKQPKETPGLVQGKYKNREFEAFTISWLPADFLENPNLCVFEGPGARLFATKNQCPVLPGKNFKLADTIKLAVNAKNAVAMWGPYEIRKEGFDRGVARKKLLDGGTIRYRADDRLYQKDKAAISCFHAMAGLDELFPRGGLFNSGLRMWGFNGTARVLIEYTEKPLFKKLILEPVDVKKDRSFFVYAATANGPVPYNPAKVAAAYHQ